MLALRLRGETDSDNQCPAEVIVLAVDDVAAATPHPICVGPHPPTGGVLTVLHIVVVQAREKACLGRQQLGQDPTDFGVRPGQRLLIANARMGYLNWSPSARNPGWTLPCCAKALSPVASNAAASIVEPTRLARIDMDMATRSPQKTPGYGQTVTTPGTDPAILYVGLWSCRH